MFKQLTYFQYLEDDMRGLQLRAQELNSRLVDAYSPPEQLYCSLQQQVDAILNEEEQLSSVASLILQQVACNSLVPAQPDSLLVESAAGGTLPEWFPHVLEKEYGRAKGELDAYARSLCELHQLEQKRKAMRGEREALETLYRRSIAITATQKTHHFNDIDIMQDVQHLCNRIRHVRKTFQHFCSQVAGKIREFVEQLADRTTALSLSRPQSPPSSLQPARKLASEVFRQSDNLGRVRPDNRLVAELPEESFKTYGQVRNISPRTHFTAAQQTQPRIEPSRDKYQDYYGRSAEIRAGENRSPLGMATRTKQHERSHFQQDVAGSSYGLRGSCRNHEDHSTLHRHTCEKGREWLRPVKSEERFLVSPSPRAEGKYDFRRYLPARGEYY